MFGYFEDRRKGTSWTKPLAVVVNEVARKPTTLKPTAVNTEINAQKGNTPVNTEITNKSQETEAFAGVLASIERAKITDPVVKDKTIKMNHLPAIHGKNF